MHRTASLPPRFLILVMVWGTIAGSGVDAASSLPVREVTIFKDGHAFVLHEGAAAVAADGTVQLDDLPTPVIGTFWPFSSDEAAPLRGASAGPQRVQIERTALTVRELIEANVGAAVILHLRSGRTIAGRIGDVPFRDAAELEESSGSTAAPRLREAGSVLLLETEEGLRTVGFDDVVDVTFRQPPQRKLPTEQLRNMLTLRLDWPGGAPAAAARVGMTYLQKGLRWIPHYRVTLLPGGQALVELQATLLNELADLDGVKAHLVIGAPTFQFEETLDPLALDQTLDQLSVYFRKQQASGSTAYRSHFSNSIMLQTQVSRMSEHRGTGEAPLLEGALGAEAAGDGDLFVFTLEGLRLRQGERMVTTVGRWTVNYEDLYRLKAPIAPPPELRQHFGSQREAELAELQHQPKVQHVARLKNTSPVPFTTAPALLVEGGRALAQGMMTYTSVGSSVDLEITAAVNVPASIEDEETGRVPDAARLGSSSFQRIDLTGRIVLTNYQSQPIRIEVERMLLGKAAEASRQGRITTPGFPGSGVTAGLPTWPDWWWRHSWPSWWRRLNSLSTIRWVEEIPAGETLELTYGWHYFWG